MQSFSIRHFTATGLLAAAMFGVAFDSAPAVAAPADGEDGLATCPNLRLNQTIPPNGEIVGYGAVTDGGARFAFLGDLEEDDQFDLFTVPASGAAAPVRFALDTPLSDGLRGFPIFSPDGSRAVFRGDFEVDSVIELYSIATTDGGGTPVKLNGPLVGDVQREFLVTPDGSQVLYLAEELSNNEELYAVALLGGPSRRVNTGDGISDVEGDFAVSTDSAYVVYRDPGTSFRDELYSAPLAGGPPVKLSGTLQSSGNVSNFLISSDGGTVIYRADQEVDGRYDLYQVPISGGAAVRISGSEVEQGVDDEFSISPDGTRVVYLNPRIKGPSFGADLYSVDLIGGAPIRLNDPLPANGTVGDFAIDPTSSKVVFEGSAESADLNEIFTVPIGGGVVTKISGDMQDADGTFRFALSPDGSTVVFRLDRDLSPGVITIEIMAVPLAGGPVSSLAGPLMPERQIEQQAFSPDGNSLVYAAQTDSFDRVELFVVPLDGSAPVRRINQILPDGATVGDGFNDEFQFSDDGRFIVFLADQDTAGVIELWSAELSCDELDAIFSDRFSF